MAKGHKCPLCGRNTLQPETTKWFLCSNCGIKVPLHLVMGKRDDG
jgi:ribosomal protein L37AE/L43A